MIKSQIDGLEIIISIDRPQNKPSDDIFLTVKLQQNIICSMWVKDKPLDDTTLQTIANACKYELNKLIETVRNKT